MDEFNWAAQMASTVITAAGLELLNQVPQAGGDTYWIGYYGLAFVPAEKRIEGEDDELKAGMTSLTKTGDHIYNLWQGSMVASGYAQGTSAAELGGVAMYTSNLMSRFRYVLDKDGNNNLVMFRGTTDSSASDVSGACVFRGVRHQDQEHPEPAPSKGVLDGIPLPAPLFFHECEEKYDNPPADEATFTREVPSDPATFKFYDYPTIGSGDKVLPAVTTDTRAYIGKTAAVPEGGDPFNAAVNGVDTRQWLSANKTYTQDGLNGDPAQPLEPDYNCLCEQYWKFKSISNYNRYHAPASSEGFLVDYEPACRNMAKVTRLFPISHYKVVNAKEGASSILPGKKIASTLRFSINMSLDDIYNTVATRAITQSGESGIESIGGADLFQTKESSIKFNRIGIYAAKMTVHRFYKSENNASNRSGCEDFRVQFEIDGNAEPILFAVVDLDTTVYLREGSGETSTYKVNVDLNLGDKDTGSVIRDASVFYNMYEDNAITWYENQLIATASQAEAITDVGLDMAIMKQRMDRMTASVNGCQNDDSGDEYAPKNHTHNFMKNLVDGTVNPGAVRGVDCAVESLPVDFSIFDTFNQSLYTATQVSERSAQNKIQFFTVHGTPRS